MYRQVWLNGKWIEGLPTEAGQRYRFMTPAGYQYGTYVPESAPEVADMRITKLAFKQRFTQDERIAIRSASETIPQVYDFQDLVNSATFIDLSRQDTIDAVNAIEQLGLIEAGRASIILGPPVEDIERYKD